jgi:Phytanoyl-CoA dioxygenase (PhyH)
MASIVEFESPPTPEMFRRAMEANGVAKISGLLSAQTLADLQMVVDRSYAAIDRRIARGEPIDADLAGDFRLWNGINNKLVGPLLTAYEPELAPQWSALLTKIESSFWALLGPSWRFCPEVSWFRRHNDEAKFVAWHIDADAATAGVYGITSINMWLPLGKVGGAAPSLEFLPASHRVMRDIPALEGGERYRSDDWVRSTVPGRTWTPAAAPGDAILFDQFTLHRTQIADFTDPSRLSCELRFVLPSTIPRRAVRKAKAVTRRIRTTFTRAAVSDG